MRKLEESWDVLSRRHLLEEAEILEQCTKTGQIADFTIASLEEKANESFVSIIESHLNTPKMHQLYIDFLIERLKMDSKYLNDEVFIYIFLSCVTSIIMLIWSGFR